MFGNGKSMGSVLSSAVIYGIEDSMSYAEASPTVRLKITELLFANDLLEFRAERQAHAETTILPFSQPISGPALF